MQTLRKLKVETVAWRLQVHLMGPPIPPCEKDRLTTLHALSMPGGVEAPPDPELQTILKLVKSVFDVSATTSRAACRTPQPSS
jgi:hypothetical protein